MKQWKAHVCGLAQIAYLLRLGHAKDEDVRAITEEPDCGTMRSSIGSHRIYPDHCVGTQALINMSISRIFYIKHEFLQFHGFRHYYDKIDQVGITRLIIQMGGVHLFL